MIEERVKELLDRLGKGNGLGEAVTLIGATKTRTPEEINRAIRAGLADIGENKVQEFRDKYDLIQGARRHFIGHLQTNKVKYLIGKVYLIHSVDRDDLAREIAARSVSAGVTTSVLLQINIGNEETKGGYPLSEGYAAYERWKGQKGLCIKGFMAMLPAQGEREYLCELCDNMRALYERAKREDKNIEYLSMGMSGDWELCLERGANAVRLGTAIFGDRDYADRR